MQYKIGLAGAPLSGKTTLGAMLYAQFLKQGVEGAYLIDEYAKLHLAKGKPIKGFRDQFDISKGQLYKENEVSHTTFSPIISDSCVWLGKVYLDLNDWGKDHVYYPFLMNDIDRIKYDVTIYIPLQDTTGEVSEFRVHGGEQSARIAYLIEQELKDKGNVVYAPIDYKDRDQWVEEFVKQWKVKHEVRALSETKEKDNEDERDEYGLISAKG